MGRKEEAERLLVDNDSSQRLAPLQLPEVLAVFSSCWTSGRGLQEPFCLYVVEVAREDRQKVARKPIQKIQSSPVLFQKQTTAARRASGGASGRVAICYYH